MFFIGSSCPPCSLPLFTRSVSQVLVVVSCSTIYCRPVKLVICDRSVPLILTEMEIFAFLFQNGSRVQWMRVEFLSVPLSSPGALALRSDPQECEVAAAASALPRAARLGPEVPVLPSCWPCLRPNVRCVLCTWISCSSCILRIWT